MKLSVKLAKRLTIGSLVPLLAMFIVFQSRSQANASAPGDGAETFKSKCASCHAADGSGNTPAGKALKIRDLGSADVQGQSDDQLLEIVSKGKGKMPAYEKTLGADKCKELVAFIRTLKK
jgi:cytochrome c6